MKKNVLLLIGYLSNGGAERSITRLANELEKYCNVTLAVASKRNQDYDCKAKIIEIKEFQSKKTKLAGIFKLRKLKKELKIDTTISYTTAYNFYNVMAKYKDKTVISIRNHLSTKNEGFIWNTIHKITLRLCNEVICCSQDVKNDQLINYKANPKKLKVITNFCDLEEIKKEANKKSNKKDAEILKENYIVTMARMVPHKGHKHIIKALSLVNKKLKSTKLLIFSRGPLKEELKELARKYKIEDNVIFMDFHPNPYMFLKKAKCFILASDYEGFPNVIMEAMACGTPIISTDVPGGSKEILTKNPDFSKRATKLVESDYGILIPGFAKDHTKDEITPNEKILSEAILNFCSDQNFYQKYHKKSLERVKEYSNLKVIKDWLDII